MDDRSATELRPSRRSNGRLAPCSARAAAGDGALVQAIYGGVEVDADRLFETRSVALTLMIEWAAEARALAAALGFE